MYFTSTQINKIKTQKGDILFNLIYGQMLLLLQHLSPSHEYYSLPHALAITFLAATFTDMQSRTMSLSVWLLQPTCYLDGQMGKLVQRQLFLFCRQLPLTPGACHVNLFWQVTHHLKQHNSHPPAATERQGELPSNWGKTKQSGFLVSIHSQTR